MDKICKIIWNKNFSAELSMISLKVFNEICDSFIVASVNLILPS